MPDLVAVQTYCCASNESWQTQVEGTRGSYTVTYGRNLEPNLLWDYAWSCTCKAFTFRKRSKVGVYCKHIQAVMDTRCAWNSELDPGPRPDLDAIGRPICPLCKGRVIAVRVAI